MSRKILGSLAGALLLFTGFSAQVFGANVVKNENLELNIGGRMQMMGALEYLQTVTDRQNARIYLYQRQTRLDFSGKYNSCDFRFQFAFGGDETVSTLVSRSMLDAYVNVPLLDSVSIRVGQFKVPYSRERLADSGELQFVDRSINNLAFTIGRDYGFAVHGYKKNLAGVLGIFSGGGPNVPIRYIPELLNIPMVVLRAGINKELDRDIFTVKHIDFDSRDTKWAAYVNAMYTKDSRIGHSSVLSTRSGTLPDKSLLVWTAYNPYLRAVTASQIELGEYVQGGADFGFQKPLGKFIFTADAEANTGYYANSLGRLNLSAAKVQGAVYKEPFEVALRYAIMIPDKNFAYYDSTGKKSYTIFDENPIQEITPALSFYFKKHELKLQFDAPIGFNVPVVQEAGLGGYSLLNQPDQTSLLKTATNTMTRQTTVTGRMVFQFAF